MKGARNRFIVIAVVETIRLGGELHLIAVESFRADFAASYTVGG
jgi:hypothetical protein